MENEKEQRQAGQTKLPASQKPSLQKRPQTPWTPSEKANLAIALGQVCELQRQYGKNAGNLETMVNGFAWILADYPMEKVLWAFGQYVKYNTNIPTPSEIVALIDPPKPEWKPDKSYYVRLQQIHKDQGPYGLDTDEIEYIRKYEDHMRKEMRDAR